MIYTGQDYIDNFFAHHGIKGQKWGIRRYQNPDGSLTEAGRKRYFYTSGQTIKKRLFGPAQVATGGELTKKGVKALTNKKTGELSEMGKSLVSSLTERSKAANAPSHLPKGSEAYRVTTKGEKITTKRTYVTTNNADRMQYAKWAINGDLPGAYNAKGLVVNEYKFLKKTQVAPMLESINTAVSKLKDVPLSEARKTKLVTFGIFTKQFAKDLNIGKLYSSGGAESFGSTIKADKKEMIEARWLSKRNAVLRNVLGSSLDKIHNDFSEEGKKRSKEFKAEMKKKGYDAVVDTYDATLEELTGLPYILLNPKNTIKLKKQNVVWEPAKKKTSKTAVAHSGMNGCTRYKKKHER